MRRTRKMHIGPKGKDTRHEQSGHVLDVGDDLGYYPTHTIADMSVYETLEDAEEVLRDNAYFLSILPVIVLSLPRICTLNMHQNYSFKLIHTNE